MKKFLATCIILFIVLPALWLGYRYSSNQKTLIPKPYLFSSKVQKKYEIDAPILIVGDKIAGRLTSFKKQLATKISVNLSKPIKIDSLAKEGEGLHRTFEKMKSLERLPLIIIYLGNTDENKERKFRIKDIKTIEANLRLYRDPKIRSTIMALPIVSKFLYAPTKLVRLGEDIKRPNKVLPDNLLQRKLALDYKLYEATLDQFFNFITKRGSFLIPVTTPLNLLEKPQKNCYGSLDPITEEDLKILKDKLKQKDYKGAYNISKDLALINQSHATSLFLHGFVSFKLNKFTESQKYLERAIALDCGNLRGTPIYNSILRKVAKTNKLQFLDFHQYLVDQSQINYTFIDSTYPQDFYMEKLTDILALKIRTLLKLN